MASMARVHQLVARHWKWIKPLIRKASREIEQTFPRASLERIPVPARAAQGSNVHPLAWRKQVRQFSTTPGQKTGVKYDRSSLPKSPIGNAVNRSTGRAPFASTLRPNLTGGTLNRTAGGYSAGGGKIGGARYFSHGPTTPAEVIQNVSQAVRAFYLSGQKARFDGVGENGDKRYRAVSSLQDDTLRKIEKVPTATPGSYIDFKVNPTITALTPLSAIAGFEESGELGAAQTLNSAGLLDVLSADFSRALQDLTKIMHDLDALAKLGDLPLSYRSESASLRVHFAGCDAGTVEGICAELGVKRGVVSQDAEFDAFVGTEMALLFPFAPSNGGSAAVSEAHELGFDGIPNVSPPDPAKSRFDAYSTQSDQSEESAGLLFDDANPWVLPSSSEGHSSPEGYARMPPKWSHGSSFSELENPTPYASDPLEYQNFEGLYRFIEMCDDARR